MYIWLIFRFGTPANLVMVGLGGGEVLSDCPAEQRLSWTIGLYFSAIGALSFIGLLTRCVVYSLR